MSERNDLERARALGMTLEEFQSLVGHDPLDRHTQFLAGGYVGPKDTKKADDSEDVELKPKKKKADLNEDALEDLGEELLTFETDRDVRNKTARENEHAWDSPVVGDEAEAIYYGFHVHSKDNMYGLHTHIPGGTLGGGHLHGPQNRLGYHTHRYSQEELLEFKFARPGIMIQLDGPHEHRANAPDGKHVHCEENFGPASDSRAQDVAERNSKTDRN